MKCYTNRTSLTSQECKVLEGLIIVEYVIKVFTSPSKKRVSVGDRELIDNNPSEIINALIQRMQILNPTRWLREPSILSINSEQYIKDLLIPPTFKDAEENRRAKTLYTFLLITPIISNLIAVVAFFRSSYPSSLLAIFLFIDLVVITSLILIRRRLLIIGAIFFLLSMWLTVTYVVFFVHNELSSPALGAFLLIILGAGLFVGPRMAITFTGLAWVSLAGFLTTDYFGLTPKASFPLTEQRLFIIQSLVFTLGLVLVFIAILSMKRAIKLSRQQEEEMSSNNLKMQEVLASLEQRISERTLEITQQKRFFEALVLNSPIAIVTLDNHHCILSCNPAFADLFGYTQNEVIGKDLDSLITTNSTRDIAKGLTHQVLEGETVKRISQRRRKDGSLIDVEIYGVPVLVEDHQVGVLAMYNDITERVKNELHLKHLATHDPLTLLPNRSLFYEHLNQALRRARRNKGRLAVFFLDLDGFKFVNDLLGHAKGDELLKEVAARFSNALRSSDIVARLGGDEFAFVCENISNPENAATIAKKILISISKSFHMEGQEISISGSIGISLYPEDSDEARDLLRYADAAMYRVKGQGKQHYQFFSWAGRSD
jgi:diguanylate cyclase (GGDEF)-like protein/PAS domain S-box-containing protein